MTDFIFPGAGKANQQYVHSAVSTSGMSVKNLAAIHSEEGDLRVVFESDLPIGDQQKLSDIVDDAVRGLSWKFNPERTIYIKGNDTADGGERLVFDGNDLAVETREGGAWNPSELKPQTLKLGNGMTVSVIGSILVLNNTALDQQFMGLHVPFSDAGTTVPLTPVAGQRFNQLEFQEDFSVERVLKTATRPVFFDLNLPGGLAHAMYFKTGNTAAASDVVVQLSRGLTPGGEVFFERVVSASEFSALADVRVPMNIGFFPGVSFLISLTSVEEFSILGSSISDLYIAADFQDILFEEVLSHPTGFNRLLSDRAGNLLTDRAGNVILAKPVQPAFFEPAEDPLIPPFSDPPPVGP